MTVAVLQSTSAILRIILGTHWLAFRNRDTGQIAFRPNVQDGTAHEYPVTEKQNLAQPPYRAGLIYIPLFRHYPRRRVSVGGCCAPEKEANRMKSVASITLIGGRAWLGYLLAVLKGFVHCLLFCFGA